MFERYTETARRALFLAHGEASQRGSSSIESEHLLLGLIRDAGGLAIEILARTHVSGDNLRRAVEGSLDVREKRSTVEQIQFSAEVKRILQFAAEEADRLLHDDIGSEHLLLGILREERSAAASISGNTGFSSSRFGRTSSSS